MERVRRVNGALRFCDATTSIFATTTTALATAFSALVHQSVVWRRHEFRQVETSCEAVGRGATLAWDQWNDCTPEKNGTRFGQLGAVVSSSILSNIDSVVGAGTCARAYRRLPSTS